MVKIVEIIEIVPYLPFQFIKSNFTALQKTNKQTGEIQKTNKQTGEIQKKREKREKEEVSHRREALHKVTSSATVKILR